MKRNQVGVVLLLEFLVIIVMFILNLGMASPDSSWYRRLNVYADIPSMLCILLFVLPTLFATGAAKDFGRAFQIGRRAFTIGQMKKSLEAVKLVQKLIMYSALFSTGISIIVVLYSLSDPSSIGPCLAIICLSFLYASILEVLLLPLYLHVQNWLIDAMDIINEENEEAQ